MSNLYESGEKVPTGNPIDNNYVYSSGELVDDGGESDFFFISGVGVGSATILVSQWDASKGDTLLSDGSVATEPETVDEWVDYQETANITGDGPIRRDNELNGNSVVEFDGSGGVEYLDTTPDKLSVQEPFSIVGVPVTIDDRDVYTEYLYDSSQGDSFIRYRNGPDKKDWIFSAGSGTLTGSSNPSMPRLLTGVCDGSNSVFRENGNQVDSGTLSGNVEGITVGNRDVHDRAMHQLAELRVYNGNIVASGQVDQIESDVASTWGLSI